MIATAEALQTYLRVFHETLDETVSEWLPQERRNALTHTFIRPAEIIGYVSAEFGVAVEYRKSTHASIRVVSGSGRVEDLFVQAPRRMRNQPTMFVIPEDPDPERFVGGNGFYSLTIDAPFPFKLAGTHSIVRFGDVAFQLGPWRRVVDFAEVFGNNDLKYWTVERAIARAKDEVLSALVQLKRAEERKLPLGEYLRDLRKRTVLLLGDYSDSGLLRLELLKQVLIAKGYEPILVKDVPDQSAQDLPQKVAMLAALSRFIVVDDSSKSGHVMEIELCKQRNWITLLLRKQGEAASWMSAGASVTSNVILEQEYSESTIDGDMSTAIAWAENKVEQLEKKFENLFPWRSAQQN